MSVGEKAKCKMAVREMNFRSWVVGLQEKALSWKPSALLLEDCSEAEIEEYRRPKINFNDVRANQSPSTPERLLGS